MAVWGCAPWDNNPPKRGVTPGHPAAKPVAAKPAPPPARTIAQPAVQSGGRVITHDGGSLISNKGGGVLSDNGLGRRGGGVINPANTSSSLIGNAGGTMRR